MDQKAIMKVAITSYLSRLSRIPRETRIVMGVSIAFSLIAVVAFAATIPA